MFQQFTQAAGCSDAKRIGLWEAFNFVRLERSDGTALIEPDVLVELPWQDGLEIVAGEFALRPVNDADCPFEPRFHQSPNMGGILVTQVKYETWHLAVMTESL